MTITNQLKNQHLLWRAGFGPMAEDISGLEHTSQKSLLHTIFKTSAHAPASINVAENAVNGLQMGIGDINRMRKGDLSPDEKKQLRKQSQDDIKSLNIAWLNEMVNSEAQLREKTALFWHGHFASRNVNIYYQQLLLDVIRNNALGNFRDLLHEVSKSAAMLNFLNNNQNKKDHPNENFAREVMELFTIGRANYTEQDVKEAARAFTGWGTNLQGEFVFRKMQHDYGIKTIFGKTGNFDGDDVLDMLLEKKQTAILIAKKLYLFFVNDNPDDQEISWLADRFYQNNYDIKKLAEDIFTSNWFYEPKNIAARIKSPVELLVGIRRMLPMKIENEASQLLVQRLLGQLLFYPPNVAGWPGGTNWIDSSALMFRLRLPQIIYQSDEVQLKPKDDDDQMMGMMAKNEASGTVGAGRQKGQMLKAEISWDSFIGQFQQVPRENLAAAVSQTLLQTSSGISQTTLEQYIDKSSRENYIKTTAIRLMGTPEYQLC